ncbi:hypothetical protein Tco_0351835 [Tanacetum coccineum]
MKGMVPRGGGKKWPMRKLSDEFDRVATKNGRWRWRGGSCGDDSKAESDGYGDGEEWFEWEEGGSCGLRCSMNAFIVWTLKVECLVTTGGYFDRKMIVMISLEAYRLCMILVLKTFASQAFPSCDRNSVFGIGKRYCIVDLNCLLMVMDKKVADWKMS